MHDFEFCSKMNSFTQTKLKLLCPSCLSMSKEVSSLKFFISPCMKKKQTEQVMHDFGFGYDKAALLEGQQ